MTISVRLALPSLCALLCSASALADFAGQTILGNLMNGSVVSGDTSNASDDNDGFTSGMHIFDIWDGGDDVWALDWAGGNMRVDLAYDNSLFTDVDLFVYRPGGLDDSGDYAIANTGLDSVTIAGAGAGTYYIVIDSTAGAEGAYELSVTVPAPGALAVGVAGLVGLARRRR